MTPELPALFVPHGAPTFALRPGAAGAALAAKARILARPSVVLAVSPHWETEVPTLGSAERPTTIHDFRGFPPELYQIRYPAPGSPALAQETATVIESAGIPARLDPSRGLDHGAWVPLRLMYPQADVPTVPLSIQSGGGPEGAWRLGRALAPLVERGVLVLATGNLTHNLRDWQRVVRGGAPTPDYVRAFPDWVAERLAKGDIDSLLDYRRCAPGAIRAHPTEEHLLPLFVALGAAGEGARAERFHTGIDEGVLAMDAWTFHKG